MRAVVAWFVRNTVAANLLMWTIVAAGVLTMPTLTQQMFPDVDVDTVSVVVPYLGAAPEEVESGVCTRVEEAIDGTEGVKDLFSTASEGACMVRAELLEGADLAKALDDVKNRVDAIDTFPEEAEKPVISANDPLRSVIDVVIAGRADERTLKRLGERIRDGIVSLPSVTQAELINVRPDEISVEVSEAALRRHGLTFDDVARSVRTSSLDVPGGSLKTEGGEILLRTQGQAYRGAEFERILALKRPDGTRVPLGAIARVRDDFRDVDQYATFDGLPSAMVRVYRVGDQDGIEIANTVMDFVERVRESMPEGVELVVWRDNIESLRDRIGILFRNGGLGFGLVLVVLALFLRPRVAGWVSLGIPISAAGGDRPDAGDGHDGQRADDLRLHPGPRHSGRRRGGGGRERLHPSEGRFRFARSLGGGHLGRHGSGDLRGVDHRLRVSAADVLRGKHGPDVRLDGRDRDLRAAVLAGRVPADPARAPGPRPRGAGG